MNEGNIVALTNWTEQGATLVVNDGAFRQEFFIPVQALELLDTELHGYLYERAEMLTGRHEMADF